MKKRLVFLNALSTFAFIITNFLAVSKTFSQLDGADMNRFISDDNLIVPAGYTFGIWGFIYLLQIAYCAFQFQRVYFNPKDKPSDFILKTELWFFAANVMGIIWLVLFLNEYIGWSIFAMVLMLFSLLMIVQKNQMELVNVSRDVMAWAWFPIGIYAGWISVAIGPNISTYLVDIGWNQFGLTSEVWSYIIIAVLVLIFLYMILTRNMREYGLVGIWGIYGIYSKQITAGNDSIANVALGACVILLVAILYNLYKNWNSSLLHKIFAG